MNFGTQSGNTAANNRPAFGGLGASSTTSTGTTGTFGMASGGGGFGTARTGTMGTTGSTTSSYGAAKPGGLGGTGFGTGRSAFSTQPTVNYQAVLMKDPLFDRVYALRSAYNPESTAYRFCYVFYNKRLNDAVPQPPANITQNDWVKILQECPDPDHLIPVPVYGFEKLRERSDAQKALEKDISQRMSLVKAKLRSMSNFFSTEMVGCFERITHNSSKISQLMIRKLGDEDVQRLQGSRLSQSEQMVLSKLEKMRISLAKPDRFSAAIQNLEARSRNISINNQTRYTLDSEALKAVADALSNNQECILALKKAVKSIQNRVKTVDTAISEVL